MHRRDVLRYLRVEFYLEADVLGIQGNDVAISIMQVPLGELRRGTNHQLSFLEVLLTWSPRVEAAYYGWQTTGTWLPQSTVKLGDPYQ